MLTQSEKPFGPGAFHLGAQPLADKPASTSGRGLHYTTDGSHLEVWLWHAASGSETCDHDHIGEPQDPTVNEMAGFVPYKGGYMADEQKRQ